MISVYHWEGVSSFWYVTCQILSDLLQCTEEPNVSIPTMANLLIERTQNPNWVVVFKSLVTLHHVMCYGNERFIQYLASSNTNFQLSNFLDKSGVHGKIQSSGDQYFNHFSCLMFDWSVLTNPYAIRYVLILDSRFYSVREELSNFKIVVYIFLTF